MGRNLATKEAEITGGWQIILKDFEHVAPSSHVWTSETYKIFGYAPGEVILDINTYFGHIHPDDIFMVQSNLERCIKNGVQFDIKYRIKANGGEECWVHDTATVEYFFGSKEWMKLSGSISTIPKPRELPNPAVNLRHQLLSTGIDGAIPDMELHKSLSDDERAELEKMYYPDLVDRLGQTQWHLMESQRIANIGSWQIIMKDLENVVPGSHQWSDEVFRIYGYKPNEVEITIGSYIKHIHPEDIEVVLEALRGAITDNSYFDLEHRSIRKDGVEILVRLRGECTRYLGSTEWVRIIGSVKDITFRKKAERYEAGLKSVFAHTTLAYVLLDAHLNVVLFNDAAYNNVLMSPGKTLTEGSNFLEYVPKERQAEAESRYQSVLCGKSITYELPFTTHDRRQFWFLVRLFPTRSVDGNITGIALATEDITERKMADEALREKNQQLEQLFEHLNDIREEERKSIAQEIHDELGQQLTTVKTGAAIVKRRMKDLGIADPNIEMLLDEVGEAIKSVRRISTSLHPMILEHKGLAGAASWLIDEFQKRHAMEVERTINLQQEVSDAKMAIVLFRILQESLTNIIRHASASKVTIELCDEGQEILLRVADNGVGIDLEGLKRRQTFGIISMKERIAAVRGNFTIDCNCPSGTVVRVAVPIPQEELMVARI